MDLLLWLSGIVASAFFSWLFTHLYYKRALHAQQMETGSDPQAQY